MTQSKPTLPLAQADSASNTFSAISNGLQTLFSMNAGTGAPSTPVDGEMWWDTSGVASSLLPLLKVYNGDGGTWIPAHLGEVRTITNSDSPYTVVDNDFAILVDSSGGAVTINLQTATNTKWEVWVGKISTDNNTITIAPNGSEKINNVAEDIKISQYGQAFWMKADGTDNWFFMASFNYPIILNWVFDADNSATGLAVTDDGTEKTLASFTLPAKSIFQNSNGIRVECGFRMAANTNTKRIRIKFAGTNFVDYSSGSSFESVHIWVNIMRAQSSTACLNFYEVISNLSAGATNEGATTEDFTIANLIEITGQATAANDMVLKYFRVYPMR